MGKHHVHSGAKIDAKTAKAEAKANKPLTSLNQDIKLSMSADDIMLDGKAKVSKADQKATNGVVHVIDAVLVPPNVDITGFTAPPATKKPAPKPSSSGALTATVFGSCVLAIGLL